MSDPLVLPVGVSIAIVAFLLSLLPAGFFLWVWYLRNRDRSLPAGTIAQAFGIGMLIVWPAFLLEKKAHQLWQIVSPATEQYYSGSVLPLISLQDIVLPALATFLIVALVEEGLRYGVLRYWIKRSKKIDQVFDGLLIGVAVGLGFATLENTLYFTNLLGDQQFDTLVFVFFLRFVISTLAHISFGGIMGTLIARGVFHMFNPRQYLLPAFFIPWFLHGLFDLLLGTGQGLYAIMILLPALFTLILWTMKREFYIVHRKDGAFLATSHMPEDPSMRALEAAVKTENSPWNKYAPWLNQNKSYRTILNVIKSNR
ncbi:MAG TPA: PrsW family glutamic-type intramembrane protease [Candidatus Andersenbacteria bacterium]|nr:PrsW family glutamic-type intramembrane protease [Candidatus Andersenbacteria bacterium]